MSAVLLIDIGSTFTKVCSINLDSERIMGTAQSGTTISDDVCIGIEKAMNLLSRTTGISEYSKKMACSSAAGGLAVMVSGLVESLTLKAAKLAAMGAGAKITKGFHHQLTDDDLQYISESDFDIFLLTGGTDGGNQDVILYNSNKLAGIRKTFPFIVAGNRVVAGQCAEILKKSGKEVHICPNILPKVDQLNIKPVNEQIRKIFLEKITDAKGIGKAEELIDHVLMPTPYAVLSAVELLAEGTGSEPGLGEIMAVDVGGATTDVHSVCNGYGDSGNTVFEGFAEPRVKRTVEGDLGVRYNASSIISAVADKPGNPFTTHDRIESILETIRTNPWLIPELEDSRLDEDLCKTAVEIACKRHCGIIRKRYTSNGIRYIQSGKNLSDVKAVIGTGGVLVNSTRASEIMSKATYSDRDPDSLRPKMPELYLDKSYILPAMGLLATIYPEKALRIMKKEIVRIHRGIT